MTINTEIYFYNQLKILLNQGNLKPNEYTARHLDKYLSLVQEYDKSHPLHRVYVRRFLNLAAQIPLFGVHRYDLTDADENDIWLGISNTGISIYDKDYEIQLTFFNFRCIMEVSYSGLKLILMVRNEDKLEKVIFKCHSKNVAEQIWKLAVDHLRFFRTTVIKCPLKKSRTFDQIQLHLEKKDITRTPLTRISNTRSFNDHNDLNETDNRVIATPRSQEQIYIFSSLEMLGSRV